MHDWAVCNYKEVEIKWSLGVLTYAEMSFSPYNIYLMWSVTYIKSVDLLIEIMDNDKGSWFVDV